MRIIGYKEATEVKSLKTPEQFRKILRENKGILYKVINIYCKNPADRKDLEQEIVIQLWHSLGRYDKSSKLSTWIYKVAMNVSISFYRKNKLRTEAPHIPIDSIFLEEETQQESEFVSKQKRILYAFIEQLNDFEKAIILLYLEEYNYKEIAEIVGISETNVGTKISRIKNKLKSKYTKTN